MYLKPLLVVILFSCILLRPDQSTVALFSAGNPPAEPHYLGDVAVDCGSIGNSTALDGREWIGDTGSELMSSLQPKGRTRSSIAVDKLSSVDGVPYRTSRISATPFQYTFRVTPGQIFLRLHFYPASYRGFEKSLDLFTVKAGPFTLLRDFSASLTADGSGEKYVVKEFCLNVEVNAKLNVTFSPSKSSKLKKVHAFVNGIEIISIPAGLYYTSDGELGARMVGLNNRFYIIENSTALEVVQRLNIGGGSISPIEDFGMFRRWSEDSKYLQESGVRRVSHLTNRIKYTNMPAFVAPPRLYHTAWKIGRGIRGNEMYRVIKKLISPEAHLSRRLLLYRVMIVISV